MMEELVKEAKEKLHVSIESNSLYEKMKDVLLESVNNEMTSRPDIHELIGHNPLQMMYDNHQNHINFMINVFKFGYFEMLVKIVPWVYRSYHSHGFAYDYFPVELKTWQKAIKENLDEKNACEINSVYDWLIEKHDLMLDLFKKEPSLDISVLPEWKDKKEKFVSFLLDADFESCIKMAEEIVKSPEDLRDFYLQIIRPALYHIGILWEKGEITVAEEHLATAIVGRITSNIYTKFRFGEQKKGKIILTAAPNEFHEVGGRIVADLLEIKGWDVLYLGANTPEKELLKLIRKVEPQILGISVAMPFNIDKAWKIISLLKSDKITGDMKIMVGGMGFNAFPDLWRTVGADGWAPDADSAVKLVEQWTK